jgi:hypothetical protein
VDDGFCDEIPALTAGFASKGFDQGFCPSWICGKDGLRVRSESIQNSRSSRIELDVKKLLNAAFQIAWFASHFVAQAVKDCQMDWKHAGPAVDSQQCPRANSFAGFVKLLFTRGNLECVRAGHVNIKPVRARFFAIACRVIHRLGPVLTQPDGQPGEVFRRQFFNRLFNVFHSIHMAKVTEKVKNNKVLSKPLAFGSHPCKAGCSRQLAKLTQPPTEGRVLGLCRQLLCFLQAAFDFLVEFRLMID